MLRVAVLEGWLFAQRPCLHYAWIIPSKTHGTWVREAGVDFFSFSKAYVERLRNGDPATEQHFFVYFERLLRIKLRARALPSDKVEDLKQDTFIRVIAALRKVGGVRQPERFGAFVNSICNNVSLEYYRSLGKSQQMDDKHEQIPDKVLDLEGMMVSKQCSERVRKILWELPARDRELLRAVFLEEKEKDTVCREMGVDRNYLRVLLHRAKHKFKTAYEEEQFRALPQMNGFGNSRNDLRPLGLAQRALGPRPKAGQLSSDSSVSPLEGVHGGLQGNSQGTT